MINFQNARRDAFKFLCSTNTVFIWEERHKKKTKFNGFVEVWTLTTELFLPTNYSTLVDLIIAIPSDFPLVLPKVYIDDNTRNWVGYIPHVNADNFICVYDEEFILTDPNQPGRIVKECLDKALQIIETGITRTTNSQFQEEFIAYWEENSDEKDQVIKCLNLINTDSFFPNQTINFLHLKKPFGGYNIIFYQNNSEFNTIISYLKSIKLDYSENKAFYLGATNLIPPPYGQSNEQINEMVKYKFNHLYSEFVAHIKSNNSPKLILLSLNSSNEIIFFGYYLPSFLNKRKGFRSISNLEAFNRFQKHERVARLKLDTYSKKRLNMRTNGYYMSNPPSRFTFVGLGSIGANLLMSLLSLEIDELTLIDPEYLTIENINRHPLGMDDVNNLKIEALKHKIQSKDPLMKVNVYKDSVVNIIQNQIDLLNNCDLIFIAIGKTNIESLLCNALNERLLTKPLIIIWIEPHLYGGHCLYFVPGEHFNYLELYNGSRYKYNIISDEEYINPLRELQFTEAGCQGSYTPYGKKDIFLFMAKLVPLLFEIIENKPNKNERITWRGYDKGHINPSFAISQVGLKFNQGEIQRVLL